MINVNTIARKLITQYPGYFINSYTNSFVYIGLSRSPGGDGTPFESFHIGGKDYFVLLSKPPFIKGEDMMIVCQLHFSNLVFMGDKDILTEELGKMILRMLREKGYLDD